jgi:hypothetical protein
MARPHSLELDSGCCGGRGGWNVAKRCRGIEIRTPHRRGIPLGVSVVESSVCRPVNDVYGHGCVDYL